MGVQPDHEVGFPRSFEPEATFGKHDRSLQDDRSLTFEPSETFSSTTPHDTQTHSDGAPSFTEYCWPVTGQHPQSHGSSAASWENSFTSTAASTVPTMVPVPNSSGYFVWNLNESSAHRSRTAPLDYRWNNESGPSTNAFHDMASIRARSSFGNPINISHRTCKRRINPVPVRQRQNCGSSHMRYPMLV